MNERLNTESVRQMLNRSTTRLEQPSLARLREARMQALARFDECCTAPIFVWAGAAQTSSGQRTGGQQKYQLLFNVLILAALLFFSVNYMQQQQQLHDNTDVDLAILTDELPIDVYVD